MVDLPTLRGRAVLLRRPTEADAEALAQILREPEVARYWAGFDLSRVRREIIEQDEDAVVFTVEHAGEPIGAIQYAENLDPQYRHLGVDLFLATRAHGRGLGGDAVRTLLAHAFGTLGHHRAVIDPAADNARAIRCYERLGFRRVGILRRYERGPDGGWHDGLLMDLLAEELR
jgi:aminoglycoside 6'-N-acetyltransferase